MNQPKIIVPIADGSEEMEAVIIIDILRRADFDVTIASISEKLEITASRGVKIVADTLWKEINPNEFDAIILPGGAVGTDNFIAHPELVDALRRFNQAGKPVGAICAAPLALQNAGLLDSHTATCHPAVAGDLTQPHFTAERVVHSQNIITSQGPGTAIEFALEIVSTLASPRKAAQIKSGMVM
jgi:4-methyl-5(b-hydroxyethyl)-thiazole monophosphate biosynthesis